MVLAIQAHMRALALTHTHTHTHTHACMHAHTKTHAQTMCLYGLKSSTDCNILLCILKLCSNLA